MYTLASNIKWLPGNVWEWVNEIMPKSYVISATFVYKQLNWKNEIMLKSYVILATFVYKQLNILNGLESELQPKQFYKTPIENSVEWMWTQN